MLSVEKLSYMAWEPCILKHGAHYDDPWEDHVREKKRVRQKVTHKRVKITHIETGTVMIADCPPDADRQMGVSIGTTWKAIYRKNKILGRWTVEYV